VGLIRRATAGHLFELLTTRDGLPGSAVYSVLEDASGSLWLGTSQGLVRFDPTAPPGQRFRTFTGADGVGNVEFNRHAALRTSDGMMYFGGMDGLTGFDPARITVNDFAPPVQITRIEVSTRQGDRLVEPTALDRLELAPGDTTVRFQYAALSFTAPLRNRYAYRLDGFTNAWVDAGTRRTTQYTNLPPGAYVFRVRGTNNDGVWSEREASLDVVVRPALWQAWWFRPLVGVTLAGAVVAAYRYRAAKQREVDRLRMRIAGDLHDDLSSDLSGIAVVADLLRQNDGLSDAERDDLGSIRDASLRMADGLRDIVWYIDPDHDSLESTVRHMRNVAATLLRDIPHRFTAELPGRDQTLAVGARRNLFLVFKEAVHNIVRHARASAVEIVLTVSGGGLRLEITDDGQGFEPDAAGGGHGLASMRRRAADSGGHLLVRSQPGEGTTVALTMQMAHSRDGRRTRREPTLKGENADRRKD
jgi:signal transduction histidine kinase